MSQESSSSSSSCTFTRQWVEDLLKFRKTVHMGQGWVEIKHPRATEVTELNLPAEIIVDGDPQSQLRLFDELGLFAMSPEPHIVEYPYGYNWCKLEEALKKGTELAMSAKVRGEDSDYRKLELLEFL